MHLLCQQSAIYLKLLSHEINLHKEYNLKLAGKSGNQQTSLKAAWLSQLQVVYY